MQPQVVTLQLLQLKIHQGTSTLQLSEKSFARHELVANDLTQMCKKENQIESFF